MTKFSNVRAVLSGNTLELFRYERNVAYDYTTEPAETIVGIKPILSQDEKEKVRIRSLQRTKSTLRRIVLSNCFEWLDETGKPLAPKFVTLTFRENITKVSETNPLYTNFVKRLNYQLYGVKKSILQYVLVPEFQKRGAVHYHIVYFNLPRVDNHVLADIWSHGFVDIRNIDHLNNVGSYIAKYIGKDSADHRLIGQKHYFTSRGLKRPIVIINPQRYALLWPYVSDLPIAYAKEFESEIHGHVCYSLIDLTTHLDIKQKVLESLTPEPII
jgi:hypothetical protein